MKAEDERTILNRYVNRIATGDYASESEDAARALTALRRIVAGRLERPMFQFYVDFIDREPSESRVVANRMNCELDALGLQISSHPPGETQRSGRLRSYSELEGLELVSPDGAATGIRSMLDLRLVLQPASSHVARLSTPRGLPLASR